MKSDILVIGGGASGLMAAYSAASCLSEGGSPATVTLLEKMPRPARKIMITGKGRCNFTNLKDWNSFVGHVRSKPNALKPAFFNLNPEALTELFESFGLQSVVERGDRVFPQSHRASDVVDTLVAACKSVGVRIQTGAEVLDLCCEDNSFAAVLSDGSLLSSSRIIVATGGLSYPSTGSSGDGLRWASSLGHSIVPTFPSLTALVPRGYKSDATPDQNATQEQSSGPRHLNRSLPLSQLGESLCGVSLKNISARLLVEGHLADDGFGDLDFTDGGIEGPLGFSLSRKAVKAMNNGSRVSLELDLKPGVPPEELQQRVATLWNEVCRDPRSRNIREKEKLRILLGKLMPWPLIPGFVQTHSEIIRQKKLGRGQVRYEILPEKIAPALQCWTFDIAGYVGYERAVVTAGGVSTDEVYPKTLESRIVPGLYLCGEVLDLDADTGGYNLQIAFCTGFLAGKSAALSLKEQS
ncbi:MAG: aminoacetone oxidase family FAD-binding enzyme [Bacteroidales bacterium]|nr:aminoacetone oxidase family FAD-binding enzyme [Bacteroidales bacterium]